MNSSSINIIHGFKTATAALLAYIITNTLHLEYGHWAVLSTVIVMQVYVADSVEMCLYRLTGSISGALIGIGVLIFTPKSSFSIALALFFTIGICSFLTRYKTRYRMAAITVVIIVMTGVEVDNIITFGFSRVFEIFIGILCAFTVSVLILPRRKVDVLKNRLEKQATICSEKCCILVNAFILQQQNVDDYLVDDLVENVWENHGMLEKIKQHESFIYRKKINENFSIKISVMTRSVEHLRNMVRTLNSMKGDGYEIIMSKELKELAQKSGERLIGIIKGGSMSFSNELEDSVTDLDIKLLSLRNKGLIRRFDSRKLVQVFSFYSSLLYFAEDIIAATDT